MKPALPQGTRDFSAATIYKRQFILNTIKDVFELYGFEPLETPAMENLETLMGKYGDEGDKLIFKILDSGNPFDAEFIVALRNYMEDFDKEVIRNQIQNNQTPTGVLGNIELSKGWAFIEAFADELRNDISLKDKYGSKYLATKVKNKISGKALRYDLTIPFARYVAMNYNNLTIPYKRFQMQSVWRADRPQKGRYREFYQCDADIAGTKSLISDAELAAIYIQVFKKLKIDVTVKINSRKILAALAEVCGGADKMSAITIAIDKLDKIGIEKVKEELKENSLSEEQILLIETYLKIDGRNSEKLDKAASLLGTVENGKNGIDELKTILGYIDETESATENVSIDFTLARGLNYYTGVIYEVKANNVSIGSIGGGGRYDNLTALFGLPNIPGVGISFGVDRIYDVMSELNIFPEEINTSTKVLFFNLGEKEAMVAFKEMQVLRSNGISCELFYESVKLDKQFKYAAKKDIPFAVIIGSREMEEKTCMVKDLVKAEQQTIPLENLSSYFK